MPELPEVETTRRGLHSLLNSRQIIAITCYCSHLRHLIDEQALSILVNYRITDIKRQGKYLIICTTHPDYQLLIHLGMSGSLRVNTYDIPLKPHDHIILTLDNATELRFHDPRRFGVYTLFQPAIGHPLLDHLGVEPLENVFSARYLFTQTRHRYAPIKSVIMNQRIVAGIGNIYASEALFLSGIHPETTANKLTAKRTARLVDAIKKTLRRAITLGGSTLRDFVGADGRSGYFQQTLNVYNRAGQPCLICQTPIQQSKIAGRTSAYCPHCQR